MVFFTGYHGTTEIFFFLKIQVEFFKKKKLILGKSLKKSIFFLKWKKIMYK